MVYFVADQLPPTDALHIENLLDGGTGWFVVHTGTATGPVAMRVDILLAAPPPLWEVPPGWEIAQEATATFTAGQLVVGEENVYEVTAGVHRVRVVARGRANDIDVSTFEPVAGEEYVVTIWPEPLERPTVLVGTDPWRLELQGVAVPSSAPGGEGR